MKTFARYVILAPLATALVGPAMAQTIPPGQSCGGLLCDVGIFGHKVPVNGDGSPPTQQQLATAEAADPHALPCHDFLCRAFGQKDADAAPPPAPAPVPVAEAVPEKPAKHAYRMKRKHIATAETRAEAAPAAPADASAAK